MGSHGGAPRGSSVQLHSVGPSCPPGSFLARAARSCACAACPPTCVYAAHPHARAHTAHASTACAARANAQTELDTTNLASIFLCILAGLSVKAPRYD
jgi:hypothetical protein